MSKINSEAATTPAPSNEGEYLAMVNDMKEQYNEISRRHQKQTRLLVNATKDLQHAFSTHFLMADIRVMADFIINELLPLLHPAIAKEWRDYRKVRLLERSLQAVLKKPCCHSRLCSVPTHALAYELAAANGLSSAIPTIMTTERVVYFSFLVSRSSLHKYIISARKSPSFFWRPEATRDTDAPDPLNADFTGYVSREPIDDNVSESIRYFDMVSETSFDDVSSLGSIEGIPWENE